MSFSLYVHIPYCLSICPYCDFNAYAAPTWPEQRYIDALSEEFLYYVSSPAWQGHTLETIYFGGGTPSLFLPASLERFLALVADRCPLTSDLSISLEADPGSITQEKLQGYRSIGIDRLSLGIQSFEPTILKTLGRRHSGEEALRVIELARAADFSNLNIDVIFGVPSQTLAMVERDLCQIFSCCPEHISTYGLTYEENTPFFAMRKKGVLQPLNEETELAMYSLIQSACTNHGYQHYEISNFARPGFPSRHNTRYWQGESYLGLGAGAHSFASTPDWGRRWSNIRNPKKYMDAALAEGQACQFEETLCRDQALGEYMFLNLRQLHGMSLKAFSRRFGQAFFEEFPRAVDLIANGLLTHTEAEIKLTPQGLLVADSVFATFF